MRNIWIICRRELNSYFASPIAWLLLTMYASSSASSSGTVSVTS